MSRKQSNCSPDHDRYLEPLESRTLLAAGDPDPSFGSLGVASFNFPGAEFIIHDVALQSNGKVIAVGTKGGNLAVVRLSASGLLDGSFGTGGLFESGRRTRATSVAIQPDDKILITFGPGSIDVNLAVGRLTANGSGFDSSFGSSGIAFVNDFSRDSGNAVTLQQDGKIVVAGMAGDNTDDYFGIARYNTDGSPDTSFDGDGKLTIGFGQEEAARAVAIDYNGTPATNPFYGTIVAVGDKRPSLSALSTDFTICRLLPNGALDSRFDGDGKLTSPNLSPQPFEYATGVLIQPGGKIVATGTALASGGGNVVGDFLLARYLSGGAIDASFGPFGDGIVQTDLGSDDRTSDVALSLAGGILVSGNRGAVAAVAAYTPDGLLDARFRGGDGVLISPYSGSGHIVTSRDAIDPVRRLLLAGSRTVSRFEDIAAAVTLGAGATETNEATGPTLNVFVARPDRAPVSLRVYVNIGGTATGPIFGNPVSYDYNAAGITLPGFNVFRAYVDIPAGEAFTTFSITPINDTRIEGDETIVLSVSTDPSYDAGAPSSTTLVIRDDDVVAGPTVAESNFLYETAPQRVTFRFNQNVASSVGADDFEVTGPGGNVPFGFAYDATLNTATLTFSAILADGDFTARAVAAGITNASGQPMPADHVLSFSFLRGDANHDRRVNLADFNILAANFGQSNRTFSQGDFNYDARVNLADFNILASRFGTALGGPGRGPADGGADDDEEEQSELLRELS